MGDADDERTASGLYVVPVAVLGHVARCGRGRCVFRSTNDGIDWTTSVALDAGPTRAIADPVAGADSVSGSRTDAGVVRPLRGARSSGVALPGRPLVGCAGGRHRCHAAGGLRRWREPMDPEGASGETQTPTPRGRHWAAFASSRVEMRSSATDGRAAVHRRRASWTPVPTPTGGVVPAKRRWPLPARSGGRSMGGGSVISSRTWASVVSAGRGSRRGRRPEPHRARPAERCSLRVGVGRCLRCEWNWCGVEAFDAGAAGCDRGRHPRAGIRARRCGPPSRLWSADSGAPPRGSPEPARRALGR